MMAAVNNVTVDLITCDPYIIFQANLGHFAKFFFCKYSARWIVRAAEDEHLGARILALFLKILKIDLIMG